MALYLLPESVAREDGAGTAVALGVGRGKPLLLTLAITRALEQESLEMSIWGSPDRDNWHLLETFPQKFYCGNYALVLDLARHSDVRYLRAEWRVNRWGAGDTAPLFGFHIRMEEPRLHAVGV